MASLARFWNPGSYLAWWREFLYRILDRPALLLGAPVPLWNGAYQGRTPWNCWEGASEWAAPRRKLQAIKDFR
jgi:hypothetical protein